MLHNKFYQCYYNRVSAADSKELLHIIDDRILMHTDPLKGKTALVTGAAKRIGKDIARALSRRGVHIVVQYLPAEEHAAAGTVSAIQKEGVTAFKLKANFTDETQTRNLIRQAYRYTKKIDFLINNASVFPPSSIRNLTPDNLYRTLAINAVAPLILSQEFAKKTGNGVIINILDSRIKRIDTAHAAYSLSKNMLADITRMLAAEYAPGIRVNAVAPGAILPPKGLPKKYLKKKGLRSLLKRHGSAADVTQAVVYLLEAPYVTGQLLFVDGGQNITGAD